MNPWTTVLIVAVIVVVAVIAITMVMRTRKRRSAASSGIGLPDLGVLSMDGMDKKQSGPSPQAQEPTAEADGVDHSDSRSR